MKSKKTCQKSCIFDLFFLEGSFFSTGGVLLFLQKDLVKGQQTAIKGDR
jgi:hypothetical protein